MSSFSFSWTQVQFTDLTKEWAKGEPLKPNPLLVAPFIRNLGAHCKAHTINSVVVRKKRTCACRRFACRSLLVYF